MSDKKYQIVRTYSAGVFAGYIESRNGQEVVMSDARRLWYWRRLIRERRICFGVLGGDNETQ